MPRHARFGRHALVVVVTTAAFGAGLAARQGVPPPPLPPPPAVQQEPLPEGTAAISGVVVDGATDQPLAGAVVTLSGGARGVGPAKQLTDEKGRFFFGRLPAGENYVVAAARIGFFEATFGASRRMPLIEGQWYSTARVTLWRLGAIGGTVTDEVGEPVVNAPVRALREVMVAGVAQFASGPVARTDDRGVYRIPSLSPGRYVVNVPSVQWSVPVGTTDAALSGLAPGSLQAAETAGRGIPPRDDRTISPDGRHLLFLGTFATPPPGRAGASSMVYPGTFYPSARSPREATLVTLRNGEERAGVDLVLRPVTSHRISGVVDAPAEAQAAGMTLRLVPAGSEGLANGSEAATALVAADGSFTFLNVPAGEYTILASRSLMEYQSRELTNFSEMPTPPGSTFSTSGTGQVQSASVPLQYNFRQSRGALTHAGRLSVTVADRDLTNVVVTLKRAATLSGRFVYEGAVPPENRMLFERVMAEPADGDVSLGVRTGVATVAGGVITFKIDGLLPGRYALRISGLSGGAKSVIWDGKDYTYRAFDASDGRDFSDVVVTMTDKPARIDGYVRDDRGQVAARGAVIVFPIEREQWSGYGFSPKRVFSIALGANGSYRQSMLPAGNYLLIAVDESLSSAWRDPAFLAAAAGLAIRVTVDWGQSVTQELVIRDVPGFKGSEVPEVPGFLSCR